MNKIANFALGTVFLFSLVGCGGNENSSSNQLDTKEVSNFVDKLSNDNYTYTVIEGTKKTEYKIVDETMQKSIDNEYKGLIYTVESEKTYNYTYNDDDSKWHKTFASEIDLDGIIYDKISTVNWTAFDTDTGTFAGTMNGENVKLKIGTSSTLFVGTSFSGSFSNVGSTTISMPTTSEIVDDTVVHVLDTSSITSYLTTLEAQDYTYSTNIDGEITNYLIDGDKMMTTSNNNKIGPIYYVENDKSYNLTYDTTDSKWHKTETEEMNLNDVVYNMLAGTTWSAYNEITDVFTGSVNGENIGLQFVETTTYIATDEVTGKIYDVGATTITMPAQSEIVDETIVTPPPVIDDPVYDDTEEIYTVDAQGNYTFNVTLLNAVLTDWMKGNNQYGKDYIARTTGISTNSLNKIVYIEANSTSFNVGFVYNTSVNGNYAVYSFNNASLFNGITNGTIKTKADFVSYLNGTAVRDFNVKSVITMEYSTDNATVDQKAQFDKLTKNVFNRLATTGYQSGDISSAGTIVPDIDKANVLFGFKTAAGTQTASHGLGYQKGWDQYYIVEINGEIKFIEVHINSSVNNVSTGELTNVLNNNSKWWMCSSYSETTLDAGNLVLY